VAAGLPAGGAVAQEITGHDYDVTALVIPAVTRNWPALPGRAAHRGRHDGAWHRDWTDPRTAAQARRTTDQLASVFYPTSTGTIRNYPWSPDGPRHSPPLLIRPHQVDTHVSAEGRITQRDPHQAQTGR
jgi:hypothetical protein